jgi:hypothetical protein
MESLLGPLPPSIERKARHWFALLDEREWTPVAWPKLTDAEQAALHRMCQCDVVKLLVRQWVEVDGTELVASAIVAGDWLEPFWEHLQAELLARFGHLHKVLWPRPELEHCAARLTARGQAIRDASDPEHALLMAVSGSYFPAPGCVEWLGWETMEPTADRESGQSVPSEDAGTQTAECSTQRQDGSDNSSAIQRLLSVFTSGVADDRVARAASVLENVNLTANEKLMRIDQVLPLPAKASAEQLGELLGVSKQAVLKSDWWDQHRKGEKASEIGRRRDVHLQRTDQRDFGRPDDEVT